MADESEVEKALAWFAATKAGSENAHYGRVLSAAYIKIKRAPSPESAVVAAAEEALSALRSHGFPANAPGYRLYEARMGLDAALAALQKRGNEGEDEAVHKRGKR